MKKMKIIAVLAVLLAAVTLSACNGDKHDSDDEKDIDTTTKVEETTKGEDTTIADDTTKAEDTTAKEPVTDAPSNTDKPPVKDDFENCLFIGDSRTVGFLKYADTGKADVFASTGMNVFRVTKEEISVNGQMRTLDSYINGKKYEKIYLMLGINEIGYDLDRVIKEYGTVVDLITAAQPGATLYVQANLHITHQRSSKDQYYNNDRLNYINEGIKKFTNGSSIVYLDVNPIFDDANGGMKLEIAYDDFHPQGKYYTDWLNWIADNS